ncbi:MAG: endonuclease/exonuclease/phosphatase family protein [Acidimicrobiales bacterium]
MRGAWTGRGTAAVIGAIGLAVSATSCSGGDDPPPSGELTVLSYNVAGLPQELSDVNPEEHLPLISPLLNAYDMVLTQEDFDYWRPLLDGFDFVHYHERLRAETSHEYATAQYPGPEATGIDLTVRTELQVGDGLGVLSRFPFADEARVPWAGCFGGFDVSDQGAGDCLAAKGFAMVRVTLNDGDDGPLTVDVYTLHAEAGATDEDQRLQEADFVQLAEYIADDSEGHAVIVGGDTNLHTDSDHPDGRGDADTVAWEAFLEQSRLTDACAALDCAEPEAIDKIAFRSGNGISLTATSHDFPRERFTDDEGVDLSDHPPLVVGFRWEAEGG